MDTNKMIISGILSAHDITLAENGYRVASKAVYHHSIYAGTLDNVETVVSDFINDAARLRPACVTENEKRVYITFHDGPRAVYYTMPITCKKILSANNAFTGV